MLVDIVITFFDISFVAEYAIQYIAAHSAIFFLGIQYRILAAIKKHFD